MEFSYTTSYLFLSFLEDALKLVRGFFPKTFVQSFFVQNFCSSVVKMKNKFLFLFEIFTNDKLDNTVSKAEMLKYCVLSCVEYPRWHFFCPSYCVVTVLVAVSKNTNVIPADKDQN